MDKEVKKALIQIVNENVRTCETDEEKQVVIDLANKVGLKIYKDKWEKLSKEDFSND